MVKIMYVAHEVSGDVEGNIGKILEVCRRVHTEEVIPFAPYVVALQYLDDASPADRALGVAANEEFFRKGAIDEVGVFGSRVSKGIFGELELAVELGIPVHAHDGSVEVDVDYAMEGLRKGLVFFKYAVAKRDLASGNGLFFVRRTDQNDDMILGEVRRAQDPKTGRDVSAFVPTIVEWDEILDGWAALDERCAGLSRGEEIRFRDQVYDGLTRLYEEKKPLGRFSEKSSFDELIA